MSPTVIWEGLVGERAFRVVRIDDTQVQVEAEQGQDAVGTTRWQEPFLHHTKEVNELLTKVLASLGAER